MVALMLFNPEATMIDLDASGINSTNTGIKQEKDYLNLKEIRENKQFLDQDGNFSEKKFHDFYINALGQYNILANGGWKPTFHENNIFAPVAQRRQGPEFQEIKIKNPFQQSMSLVDIGEFGPRRKSVEEIAQTQQVWDTANKKWIDSPEESFFDTLFGEPRVLATWDYDADQYGNPTSDPDKIEHKKGEYKLNDNGTFYYETLNGRNSTEKQLLHISDIITKEDTFWNKIDFLDSDDLQKSAMGTVAKNVALIGSMFIPYVGPWIAGATILQQSLKLGATLGKMFSGSDDPFMNNLQAWASVTDLHENKSEYAKDPDHMWSLENMINLIGDAIGQLRQQRIIFEAVPQALGYGNLFGRESAKATEALEASIMKKYGTKPMREVAQSTKKDLLTASQELRMNNQVNAALEAERITKNLAKYSGAVSKVYMTGITVNDMYDEAKLAGMDDFGAMAMTLGYAAAEYALLSTGIGELVLPELRAQKAKVRGAIRGLANETIKAFNKAQAEATTPELRKNFIQKAFNKGKELYLANRDGLSGLATNMAAMGLGEGIEEVSEEFLADAIRGIHDLANWSSGKMFNSEKMFDRYAMNFIGGLVGGAVNGASIDFKVLSRYGNMSANEAMKEFLYDYRNGEGKQYFDAIDKFDFTHNNLSATELVVPETGQILYQEGTEDNNQNTVIKSVLKHQLNSIINLLEANGANISDQSLFDANTLKEVRFRMLANSAANARFSEVFAEKINKLMELALEEQSFNSLEKRKQFDLKDDHDTNEAYEQAKKEATQARKDKAKEIKEMAEGKYAADLVGAALLEMHTGIAKSFIDGPTLDLYTLRNKGKHFSQLTEGEKSEALRQYEAYEKSKKKDQVVKAYDTWTEIMDKLKAGFVGKIQEYASRSKDYSNIVDRLYDDLSRIGTDQNYILFANNILNLTLEEGGYLAKFFNDQNFISKLQQLEADRRNQLSAIDQTLPEDQKKEAAKQIDSNFEGQYKIFSLEYILNNFEKVLDETLKNKWINPVVRNKILTAANVLEGMEVRFERYAQNEEMSPQDEFEVEQMAAVLNYDPQSMSDEFLKKLTSIKTKVNQIKNLSNSPILELLDAFALDVTGKQTNFSGILADFDAAIDAANTIDGINLSSVELDEVIPNINQALKLTELIHSVMLGARADNAGYNLSENYNTGDPTWSTHFGINQIINEVKAKVPNSGEQLFTIEGELADNIMLDLHLLAKRLQFGKRLYGINNGQKLSKQPKITLRSNQLIYKALKKLYDVAPEGLDKTMLAPFFDESYILNQFKDEDSVDDKTLENLEKARIQLEDALYEFGQKNEGKELFNIEKMISLFEDKGLILNEATEGIDDNTILWHLATRLALKSSEFYNVYRQSLDENLAPLSIQELGVYIQVANALNGDALTKFKQGLRKSILDYIEIAPNKVEITGNPAFKLKETQPYIKNLDFLPRYDNISFLEGIAGSGKTRAVMKLAANIIRKINPDVLKHAFVVDTSEANADNLAKDIDISGHEALDRNSLMKRISDWKEASRHKTGKYKGYYNFKEGVDYILTSDGFIKSNYKLKSESNPASVIIIDEVGRFTDLEMQTIDEYAKAHGISVLAFGDLDQSRGRGTVTLNIKGLDKALENAHLHLEDIDGDVWTVGVNIARNNFVHGPKLGVSMRTRNIQQDKNQALLQTKIIDPSGDLLFHYYEGPDSETGEFVLNGTRVINIGASDVVEQVMNYVDKLVPTLKEGQTIGLIYQDKSSELYNKLIEKYGEKITQYEGTSAQGREARYYIMETVTTDDIPATDFVSDLYTGVTRAQDGIIVVTPLDGGSFTSIKSKQDSVQKIQKMDQQAIKDFYAKRKAMYDRIFEGNTSLPKYTERKKVSSEETTDSGIPKLVVKGSGFIDDTNSTFLIELEPYNLKDSDWLRGSRPFDILNNILVNTDNNTILLDFSNEDRTEGRAIPYNGQLSDLVDVVIPEAEVVNPIQLGTPEVIKDELESNPETVPIEPAKPTPEFRTVPKKSWDYEEHTRRVEDDPLQILFFTNAALETGGYERDSSGRAVPIDTLDPKRIDSMNGLISILGENISYDELLNHLMELHRIILDSDDRVDLDERISKYFKETLGIDKKITTQFGLWSSSLKNTQLGKKFGIYERNPKEKSLFNDYGEDSEDKNIRPRNLALVIALDGTNSLMLPVSYLSSPFTIGQKTVGKNPVYPEVFDIIEKHKEKPNKIDLISREVLNSEEIFNKYPALYNLFKLFRFDHNGFFPISNPEFSLASLRNYGIQIDKNRGVKQLNGRFSLDANTFTMEDFLKNKQFQVSNEVFMFNSTELEDAEGNTIKVLPGRPCVLVTTGKERFDTDEAMIRELLNPKSNKVKLVYLLPPTATFDEYAESLMAFDRGELHRPIGNNTTVFHILNTIRKNDPSLLEKGIKGQITDADYNKIISILEELDSLFMNATYEDGEPIPKDERNYSEFLAKLGESDDSFLPHQDTIQRKLMRVVRALTFPETFNLNTDEKVHTYSKNQAVIDRITEILGKDFTIFDSVRFNDDLGYGFKTIQHDSRNNYTINGKWLKIDARVTTPAFGSVDSSINLWIDDIVNRQILDSTWKNSRDNNTQVSGTLHRRFISGIKSKSRNNKAPQDTSDSKTRVRNSKLLNKKDILDVVNTTRGFEVMIDPSKVSIAELDLNKDPNAEVLIIEHRGKLRVRIQNTIDTIFPTDQEEATIITKYIPQGIQDYINQGGRDMERQAAIALSDRMYTENPNVTIDEIVAAQMRLPSILRDQFGIPFVNEYTGETNDLFDFEVSDTFTNFAKIADELGIEYKTPENQEEENLELLKIVNKINSDPNIRKFVITYNNNYRVIDYTNDLQSGFKSIVATNTYITPTEVNIGGKNYSMQVYNGEVWLTENNLDIDPNLINQPLSLEWFKPLPKRGNAIKLQQEIELGTRLSDFLKLYPETDWSVFAANTLDPNIKNILENKQEECVTIKIKL